MFIKQIYTGCLSQASYYIESNGEAAIIDPIREEGLYLTLAQSRNTKIKFIFETHFHADFVSGHLDLAQETGATIIFGPGAETNYPSTIARNGEIFILGNCKLKLLHTPGHTLESSCILLINETGKPVAVFTGDTLFVGDVGRPDLLSGNKSGEELASMLYDSLNKEIKSLPDDVLVYPGHGAGSLCGKNLGAEKFSTIGEQKISNYALHPKSRETFIRSVTENLPKPPKYFFSDAVINKKGYKNLDALIKKSLIGISVNEFRKKMDRGAVVLDTRAGIDFSRAFIKGSVNIGLKGEFAPWAGTLLDLENEIIFISEPNNETEIITRLARVGFENIGGYLEGGIQAWLKNGLPTETINNIDAEDFSFFFDNPDYTVIDLRRPSEVQEFRINRAINVPLENIQQEAGKFETDKKYILFCKGGYRSVIAASILKSFGINHLINVLGGAEKIRAYSPELLTADSGMNNSMTKSCSIPKRKI